MSAVTKTIGKLFSGGDGAIQAATRSQNQQRAALDAESAAAARVAAGQQAITSGGNGFLAFLDEKLKSTFGG